MVRGILVPFDMEVSLAEREFTKLEDYQEAVGGYIEAVDVPALGVTLYVNEQGLLQRLPFNARASFLWWHHVPDAYQAAMLRGDAVIVGSPDRHGDSTDVPREVVQLLLGTGEYAILVRASASQPATDRSGVPDVKDATDWYVTTRAHADYFTAVIWSMVLLERRDDAKEARVVPVAGLPVHLRPTRQIGRQ